MRVLELTGPVEGGIRRHVEALLVGLPVEGVPCGLASPAPPAQPLAPGTPWSRVGLTDQSVSVFRPSTLAALTSAWRQGGWGLIHAHGYKAATLVGIVAMRSPGIRYVVTFHNLCPRLGRVERGLLRTVVQRARGQVAVSRAVLDSLKEAGVPATRGVVIPNGIEWEQFSPLPEREAARSALGLSDEVAVLFMGRLTEEKGVLTLAEAARGLEEHAPAVVLLVAGEGPERERLAREAGSMGSLRLLGHRDDVPRLLSACDLVVVPSLREGQSLVALEAMAAGRALIVSLTGGLEEVARESGAAWTVAPGDPAALAAAIRHAARQPAARAELADRGQAYARTRGDWGDMVRQVVAVYREALGAP